MSLASFYDMCTGYLKTISLFISLIVFAVSAQADCIWTMEQLGGKSSERLANLIQNERLIERLSKKMDPIFNDLSQAIANLYEGPSQRLFFSDSKRSFGVILQMKNEVLIIKIDYLKINDIEIRSSANTRRDDFANFMVGLINGVRLKFLSQKGAKPLEVKISGVNVVNYKLGTTLKKLGFDSGLNSFRLLAVTSFVLSVESFLLAYLGDPLMVSVLPMTVVGYFSSILFTYLSWNTSGNQWNLRLRFTPLESRLQAQ